jgi:hypothetical protein
MAIRELESISIHMQIADRVSAQKAERISIHTQSSECVSAQRAEKHLHAEY